MTEEHTELNSETDRPGREWPIGGLVFIRHDARVAEEERHLRGELAVVVGPMGMIARDPDARPPWKWGQKVYCPRQREYVFLHPDDVEVLGGEPTDRGIRDVMASTAPLVRAGLARPEHADTAPTRPAPAPAARNEPRRPQGEEAQS